VPKLRRRRRRLFRAVIRDGMAESHMDSNGRLQDSRADKRQDINKTTNSKIWADCPAPNPSAPLDD
ncbi:MAG: hypothetical protein MJE68_20700, partial [Proteobacteria bacterium]|nr:hypothetical protein [Pseudomonadota bacterium]